ncbi:MAG TPA: histidine kinase dimerization/phospho-acceptor domain-containing protein [Sphingomicrobium sp.]|nr:histidine kinase dimerization/phospho-acceptor domain-containing protein [Sphingomicrobium sp.]
MTGAIDDRLRTVLAQPATDPNDRAARWRQLVEFAAKAEPGDDSDLIQQAIESIRKDCAAVDERVRSEAALAVAPLAPPVELVAAFAADLLDVAAPVLVGARLTASEWNCVSQGASEECRDFIATMRAGDRRADGRHAEPAQPPDQPRPTPSIPEVVARIERLRSSREPDEGEAPPPDRGEEAPRLFRWECNEAGEIDWVEGAPRGALVGHSIAQRATPGGGSIIERAFASRAPFHDGLLELPADAAIGGTWKISGIPAFDRSSGRFSGYRGIAERPGQPIDRSGAGLAGSTISIRELAHEIRTPLNAIIGFAEIICGEYLGPAESRFRERAAQIVSDARQLLSAVEDLDLAARLRSSSRPEIGRADIDRIVESLIDRIRKSASERGVEVEPSAGKAQLTAAVKPEVAERLIDRMCSAAIAAASKGERLALLVDEDANHCTVSISRPMSLRERDFRPDRNRRSSDGATLPIRLVMGLARTAGCELEAGDDRLTLRLPRT